MEASMCRVKDREDIWFEMRMCKVLKIILIIHRQHENANANSYFNKLPLENMDYMNTK